MATIVSNLPQQINYDVWQGDTWAPGTITATEGGVGVNFTGWSAKMEIRNAISNDVALTLTSPSSGISLNSSGVITLTMTAAQTNDLLGEYKYDLQLTNPSNQIKTYTYGTITVTNDTTANA
jgi:hypothetical protein